MMGNMRKYEILCVGASSRRRRTRRMDSVVLGDDEQGTGIKIIKIDMEKKLHKKVEYWKFPSNSKSCIDEIILFVHFKYHDAHIILFLYSFFFRVFCKILLNF